MLFLNVLTVANVTATNISEDKNKSKLLKKLKKNCDNVGKKIKNKTKYFCDKIKKTKLYDDNGEEKNQNHGNEKSKSKKQQQNDEDDFSKD